MSQPVINIHIHDLFNISVGNINIDACCADEVQELHGDEETRNRICNTIKSLQEYYDGAEQSSMTGQEIDGAEGAPNTPRIQETVNIQHESQESTSDEPCQQEPNPRHAKLQELIEEAKNLDFSEHGGSVFGKAIGSMISALSGDKTERLFQKFGLGEFHRKYAIPILSNIPELENFQSEVGSQENEVIDKIFNCINSEIETAIDEMEAKIGEKEAVDMLDKQVLTGVFKELGIGDTNADAAADFIRNPSYIEEMVSNASKKIFKDEQSTERTVTIEDAD